jgi:hypothetical protein
MTDTSAPAPGSDPTRSSPPDGGWLWIDNRVLDDHDLSAVELAVYVAICRRESDGSGWASRADLADLAGCSVDSVSPALRTLEDAGLIDSFPRFDSDGSQRANGYRVADLRSCPPLLEMEGEGEDPPGLDAYDEVDAHFHWLAHVGDEDKKDVVHAVARLTIDELGAHPEDVPLEDVVDAALAAAYPDREITRVQRDHVQSHLQEIDGESSWTWAVAAIAVAAVLGMEPARVSSVLDGWEIAGGTADAAESGADWDDRPATLEETRSWAQDHGLPPRAGEGLWYVAGRRDWECSGRVGRMGETIDDLAAWARAHKTELIAAAP